MLRRLQVALVQVKTGNTSENLLNEIHQSYFFVLRKRNYWKSKSQYNKFNKVIKQTRYYIYKFWKY